MIDDWRSVGSESISEGIKQIKRDQEEVQNTLNASLEKGEEAIIASAIQVNEHIDEVF